MTETDWTTRSQTIIQAIPLLVVPNEHLIFLGFGNGLTGGGKKVRIYKDLKGFVEASPQTPKVLLPYLGLPTSDSKQHYAKGQGTAVPWSSRVPSQNRPKYEEAHHLDGE